MIWVAVFLLAIIGEVLSGAFISIWFAGGAVTAYIALGMDAPFTVQILSFLIGTGLFMLMLKPLRNRHLAKGTIKTNADSLVGQIAIVTADISNLDSKGAVKLKGLEYTARSLDNDEIPMGEQVVVKSIDGVKLIVSTINDGSTLVEPVE